VLRCQLAAYMGQYKYFGVQVGVECWLGNNLTRATQYGTATNCDFTCTGNSGTLCGGAWANSLYQTTADVTGGLGWQALVTSCAGMQHELKPTTCTAQQLLHLVCLLLHMHIHLCSCACCRLATSPKACIAAWFDTHCP
jgi:hypothetical protein